MHSGKFNWTYVLGSALMDPLFNGHTVIAYEGANDASTWINLIKNITVQYLLEFQQYIDKLFRKQILNLMIVQV